MKHPTHSTLHCRMASARHAILFLAMALPASVFASTWTGAVSGDWGDTNNWADLLAPSGALTFGQIATENFTVSNCTTAGSITFPADANGNYHIRKEGSGKWTPGTFRAYESVNGATLHTVEQVGYVEMVISKGHTIDVKGPATTLKIIGGNKFSLNKDDEPINKNGDGTVILAGNWGGLQSVNFNGGGIDLNCLDVGGAFHLRGSGGQFITNSLSDVQTATLRMRSTVAATRTHACEIRGNILLEFGLNRATNALTQILTGNHSYTNETVVYSGTLILDGASSGLGTVRVSGTTSTLDVDGVLGGSGTIGLANGAALVVSNGSARASRGVVHPGGSTVGDTATLTVGTAGNANTATFGRQGVLRVDVANNAADRLTVVGDVHIDDGATLEVVADGTPTAHSLTVLSWTGTKTGGTFNTVTGIPENYKVRYTADSVQLVRNDLGTLIVIH